MGNMLTQGQQQITAGRQMLNNNPAAQEALIAAGLGMLKNAGATRDIGGGYYMRDRAAPLAGGMEGAMGVMEREKERRRKQAEIDAERAFRVQMAAPELGMRQQQIDLATREAENNKAFREAQLASGAAGTLFEQGMAQRKMEEERARWAAEKALAERKLSLGEKQADRDYGIQLGELGSRGAKAAADIFSDQQMLELGKYKAETERDYRAKQAASDAPSWDEIVSLYPDEAAALRSEYGSDVSGAKLATIWHERKNKVGGQKAKTRLLNQYFNEGFKKAAMGAN